MQHGYIYPRDPNNPGWRITPEGRRLIEPEVLTNIQGQDSSSEASQAGTFVGQDDSSDELADSTAEPTNSDTPRTGVLPHIAADLNDPPADRVKVTVSRIVRNTELANWVKQQHRYQCQLCGETIQLPDGSGYAEAHHLHPLGNPDLGPDIAENIVCLCPNHHAACDLGAIRLELDELQAAGEHKVGERFVRYHNEKIFRGPVTGLTKACS